MFQLLVKIKVLYRMTMKMQQWLDKLDSVSRNRDGDDDEDGDEQEEGNATQAQEGGTEAPAEDRMETDE